MLIINVRSCQKHLTEFKCHLKTIGHTFNIIGLTETWGKSNTIDLFNIMHYNHEFAIRNNQKGGGASIYVHNSMSYKIRSDINANITSFESIFLEFNKTIFGYNEHEIIGIIYKPPKSNINEFNSDIEKVLQNI